MNLDNITTLWRDFQIVNASLRSYMRASNEIQRAIQDRINRDTERHHTRLGELDAMIEAADNPTVRRMLAAERESLADITFAPTDDEIILFRDCISSANESYAELVSQNGLRDRLLSAINDSQRELEEIKQSIFKCELNRKRQILSDINNEFDDFIKSFEEV